MTNLREDWEDMEGGADAPPPKPAPAPRARRRRRRADTLAEIVAAADGLLMVSETDAPLQPFRWDGPGPLTADALRGALGLPADAPVETATLDAFLGPLAAEREWFDDAQRETARRFAALRELIAARLTDVAVYRAGRVEITAVIAGRDTAGATVGLRTTLVET